jgi:MFS family permease
VQGVGGGGLMVGALAIIGTVVPPREQGRYQGMIAAVMGVTTIAGPVVGGVITDYLGWRWCFYVNVPLGILALVMIATRLHLPRQTSRPRVDYLGVVLLSAAITATVLVTSWGGGLYGWGSPVIIGLAAVAVAAGVAFMLAERRAAEPIIPLGMFGNANFSVVTVVGFLLGFVLFAGTTFLPIFQQGAQGASATGAGLFLLPNVLALMVTNTVVGRHITKHGRYKMYAVAGGALVAVGLFMMATAGPDTSAVFLAVAMVFNGAGTGCLMQTTLLISMQSVEPKDLGVASSTATLSRTIGGSIGVSVLGAVFASRLQTASAGLGIAGGGAGLKLADVASLPDAVRLPYEQAVATATATVFLIGAVLAVVAFGVAWLVREVPLRTTSAIDVSESTENSQDL